MVKLHLQGGQPDGRMKIIRRVAYLASQIAGEHERGFRDREKHPSVWERTWVGRAWSGSAGFGNSLVSQSIRWCESHGFVMKPEGRLDSGRHEARIDLSLATFHGNGHRDATRHLLAVPLRASAQCNRQSRLRATTR